LNFNSLINIPEQHSLQIGAYHDYILQSNPESEALKMNQVIDSLALQLLKPNKKFQYKLIRKGTTYAMYKDAILMLKELEYTLQCSKCQLEELISPGQEETAGNNEENTSFKLYLPDTGFLYSRIEEENFPSSDPIVRKALLENYVAQAFHAKEYPLTFWESDSMAKIDFILRKEDCLIPVEVHINDNTRSKSISILKQKYDFPYAVKISPKNFDYSNQVKYVPYYAVFCL
jgi:predicted AAA+ superfamily ATPase